MKASSKLSKVCESSHRIESNEMKIEISKRRSTVKTKARNIIKLYYDKRRNKYQKYAIKANTKAAK